MMAGPKCTTTILGSLLALAGSIALPTVRAATTEPVPVLQIDNSILSPNRDSRVRFLVLHYTAADLPRSVALLTSPEHAVSAHYLVPDHSPVAHGWRVFQLVPEAERAWHAGHSQWQGSAELNSASLGIEIVNLGYPSVDADKPLSARHWYPFANEQMQAVGQLARDLVLRYGISPDRVIGHADIAPGRKFDPGPAFPWQWLYQTYAVGAWPDPETVAWYQQHHPWQGDIASLQRELAAYGYAVPNTGVLDPETRAVIAAFQMHWRPARYDGSPDLDTVARLEALLEKYRQQPRPPANRPSDSAHSGS